MPKIESNAEILNVRDVVARYGMKQVLNGVTLSVRTGEIVALIGHNGAGKSTLLKVVFGLLKTWDGEIFFDGVAPRRPLSPHRLLRSGIAYVPQGNRVFTDLTVYENLEFANFAVRRISRENGIRRALEIFPSLSSRVHQRAATLSGGEKQMLALASVLAVSPRLLLLDEPSLGLDRGSINQAFDRIGRVASDFGTAVLIVEQKVREVLKLANRVYVLRSGAVSYAGSADALANDESELKRVYF